MVRLQPHPRHPCWQLIGTADLATPELSGMRSSHMPAVDDGIRSLVVLTFVLQVCKQLLIPTEADPSVRKPI